MGGPRGVIRAGINFDARVAADIAARRRARMEVDGGPADRAGADRRTPAAALGGGGDRRVEGEETETKPLGGGGAEGVGAERASGDVKKAANRTKRTKKRGASDPAGDGDASVGKQSAARGSDASAGGSGAKAGGKKNKKLRQQQLMAHLSLRAECTTPVSSSDHPFEFDAADHCETPFQAYQDIEPFLFRIALALKKPKEKLRIYDPYFCEGSVAKHLARLGFTDVYNVNEDFYKCIEEKRIPEHDVLLTNPPYSGDHFRRILSFCAKNNKPWLLLLPNFVCRKQYYQPAIGGDGVKPLFLIPDALKPYRYWAPGRKGFEERNQAKGTTPFETFWYINMPSAAPHEEVRAWWLKKYAPHSRCALPSPDEALPQQQRLQKRANPRARKIAAQREREQGRGGGAPGGKAVGGGIYYDPEKAKERKLKGGFGGPGGVSGGGFGRAGRDSDAGARGGGHEKRKGHLRGRGDEGSNHKRRKKT